LPCLGEECLSFEILVELVFHVHGDVSEDVFDDFLYIFVHFVWNLFGGWKLFCTFAATIP